MITLFLVLSSFLVGFTAGALVFRRHASKAADLEAKGRSILDALKGK
jgi:hypothetical protein